MTVLAPDAGETALQRAVGAEGDAQLLGGTVVDLLARESGEMTAARLAVELHPKGPRQALVDLTIAWIDPRIRYR